MVISGFRGCGFGEIWGLTHSSVFRRLREPVGRLAKRPEQN
jgi:hypothetical protein